MPNPIIRVLLGEDELAARTALRGILQLDDDVELVGEGSGEQLVEMIAEMRPDLLFLDVQMPGLDGFGVLRRVPPDQLPLVVFVTAFEHYAVTAFDEAPLDYVLKPFSNRRILQALRRAKDVLARNELLHAQERMIELLQRQANGGQSAQPDASVSTTLGRIVVKDGTRTLFLRTDETIWIEAAGSYSRFHTVGGEVLIRVLLGDLEDRLDPKWFFRIHRSAIANMGCIQEVTHLSHGDYAVVMTDQTELRLSRSRKGEFESRLGLSGA